MSLKPIIDICNKKINNFYKKNDGLDIKIFQNRKVVIWEIELNLSKVEIVYLKKESVLHAKSTLYAHIYPRKNDFLFFYPHEMQIIENPDNIEKSSVFLYIENEKRMNSCVTSLLKTIESLFETATNWAIDEEKWNKVKSIKQEEIFNLLEIKKNELPKKDDELANEYYQYLYNLFEQCVFWPRFTSSQSQYIHLTLGKFDKVIKQYSKLDRKGKLTFYEQRILSILENDAFDFNLFSPSCDTISDIIPFTNPSFQGVQCILGCLVCFIPLSVFFCGLIYITQSIISANTLFFACIPWYTGFLLAALPSLFGGIALRRIILPIIYPKNKQMILQADKLVNGKFVSVFSYTLFIAIFIAVLLLSFFVSFDNVAFYEKHLTFLNERTFSTELKEISYNDIKCIYKIEGRYNEYGDLINRSSYVLYFKNGETLDLDGYSSLQDTKKHILPIITPYAKDPITIKSDRDLPNSK